MGARVILIDGSWDNKRGVGTGMVVYNRRGDLVLVQFKKGRGADPFHAEAEALLEALTYIRQASQLNSIVGSVR